MVPAAMGMVHVVPAAMILVACVSFCVSERRDAI